MERTYNQTVKSSDDEVLVREVLLFVVKTPKNRIGFDADDVLLYLSAKGIKTKVSVVERALDEMAEASILEKFHSRDLERTVYRLRQC